MKYYVTIYGAQFTSSPVIIGLKHKILC